MHECNVLLQQKGDENQIFQLAVIAFFLLHECKEIFSTYIIIMNSCFLNIKKKYRVEKKKIMIELRCLNEEEEERKRSQKN
jgi:hypothetical protein